MNVLLDFLAKLAIEILRYLQGREDIKNATRVELEREAMKYAIRAAEWKARAVGLPYAHDLRVRNATLTISIQSPDAQPRSGPKDCSL